LTVPCSGKRGSLINQIELKNPKWQEKHWKSISGAYTKAPYFQYYREFFEDLYLGHQWEMLNRMNRAFITKISRELLGISTLFFDSVDFNAQGTKQDRLLDLIEKTGADTYVSGPAAKNYIDEEEFSRRNIKLEWMDYGGYPQYRQVYGEFEHAVSILDLLFNVGPEAPWYIWGWRENPDRDGGSASD